MSPHSTHLFKIRTEHCRECSGSNDVDDNDDDDDDSDDDDDDSPVLILAATLE